jgi:hypothetical protein
MVFLLKVKENYQNALLKEKPDKLVKKITKSLISGKEFRC